MAREGVTAWKDKKREIQQHSHSHSLGSLFAFLSASSHLPYPTLQVSPDSLTSCSTGNAGRTRQLRSSPANQDSHRQLR